MILSFLSLALCASSALAAPGAHDLHSRRHSHLRSRAQSNPNPTVPGNSVQGWKQFPNVTDAARYPAFVIDEDRNLTMPAYQTAGLDNASIKRAVVVLPGKLRDCWYYWNSMNNALYIAAEEDSGIKRSEVSIFAPCYFTDVDLAAGAAEEGVLLWGDTTWASGHYNELPKSVKKYSAYDAMDAIVATYMNRTTYPNLNTVVVAGHSLGAQMSQRYAVLRKVTDDDDRLHYWVGKSPNPGSLCWLTEDRPLPNSTCEDVDEFKYGIAGTFPGYSTADANDLGRDGLVERYRSRTLNYAWGLKDDGDGDTRCQAETQGPTHLKRGQNFVAMLEGMSGGIPANTTIDWIANVSHYNEGMMNSDGGVDKLFRLNYNGTTAA